MAHSVNLPGGQHQLAYITELEKAFLRNQGPYANELQGALPEYNGIPVFRNPGEAGGPAEGGSEAGGADTGVLGVATAGTGRGPGGYGSHSMRDDPRDIRSFDTGRYAIGNPGDDPRASEGGGDWEIEEPRTGPGPGPGSGAGPVNGGTDTPEDDGPTEAELLAARIADAMGAISGLFAGRQGVYDRLRDSSYALSESGIADAYEKAARRLRFQMLRQGLDTGQPDIDLRADLSKVKNDSLADAMRHAQGLSESLRQRDAAKRSSLMSQALSGNLMPGQVSGMAGTLSAGVPQSWGGIADIGWNIPTGYAPSGYGGFMPDWRSQDTGAYFGSLS